MHTKMVTAVLYMVLFLLGIPGAHAEPPLEGQSFPDIALQGTLTAEQKAKLGLTGAGPFRLTDIKAEHVLVEVFSMYCPYCQREAPEMNSLVGKLASLPAGRLAVVGLGAGNSQLEVDLFRQKYGVPFALFTDENLAIHAQLGDPATPHFFLVSLKDRAHPRIALSRKGRMASPEAFAAELGKLVGK